jgi:peptidoglycan/LPS O-acetylase OafA/YrhL
MATTPITQTSEIRLVRSIQWLRGIAALAVVMLHASEVLIKYNVTVPVLSELKFGGWGVDLFFVISGFIMIFIVRDSTGKLTDTGNFWLRRLVRIAPPYWIFMSIVVAISILAPRFTEYKPSVDHILASYLFIPWTDLRGIMAPPLRIGWSLNFEAYFYLVFGLMLLLPTRQRLGTLIFWAIASALMGYFWTPASPLLQMMTDTRLLEFVSGAIIGHLWIRGKVLPLSLAIVSLTGGTILICVGDIYGNHLPPALSLGIAAIMMVSGAVGMESHQGKAFRWVFPKKLGDWSYAIYLTHILTLGVFGRVLMALKLDQYIPAFLVLLIALCVATAVGWFVYRFIEHPMHHWMDQRLFPRSRQAAT